MKNFKLIKSVILQEEADSIIINTDSNGKPYKLTEWYIEIVVENKNDNNTGLSGWKILRVETFAHQSLASSLKSIVGIDGFANLPNKNAQLALKLKGNIISIGDDSLQHTFWWKSSYNNFNGLTFGGVSKITSLNGKYLSFLKISTACADWLFGVGTSVKLYGR